MPIDNNPIGIYIHAPYCIHHCIYCDFNVYELKQKSALRRSVSYFLKEIDFFSKKYGARSIDTIYFGGGTPSLFESTHIQEILDALQKKFQVLENCSITIEANPASALYPKLKSFYDMGIQRLSLGIQSFKPQHLKTLERIHKVQQAIESYKMAQKAGFTDINLDLIFGIPNQTLSDFERDLKYILKLSPTHVSTYQLTVDAAHPLYRRLLPDRLIVKMYNHAIQTLKKAGYEHYEISAFAKPGFQSRHNLKYWRLSEFLGLGAGASSYMQTRRHPWGVHFSNIRDLKAYEEAIDQKGHAIAYEEPLTKKTAQKDYILTNLRLLKGFDLQSYEKKFEDSFEISYRYELEQLKHKRMVDIQGKVLKLKKRGYLYHNQVLMEFM